VFNNDLKLIIVPKVEGERGLEETGG